MKIGGAGRYICGGGSQRKGAVDRNEKTMGREKEGGDERKSSLTAIAARDYFN
jgi:hypothetical protein